MNKKILAMNLSKIKDILSLRYEKIRSDLWDRLKPKDHDRNFEKELDAAWAEYLNGIDCEVLDPDDIVDEFEDLFNYSSKIRICIGFEDSFVLIPNQLAEKALILGGLPDSWFPEEKPETSVR